MTAPATVTARDVEAAATALEGLVVRTPLVVAPRLSELLGCEVRCKLENLQLTGSFKDRGACHVLQTLRATMPDLRGVVAASAGNHAQGVASHARRLGIPATIVMPQSTPFSKVDRTQALGARIVLHGESLYEAQDRAHELATAESLTFVHPYDDARIVAGQGTVALEMLADWPEVEILVVPIGGGGLASGIAVVAADAEVRRRLGVRGDVRVVGVQTAMCPSMQAALAGTPQPELRTQTLADGIAVKRPGVITRELLARHLDDLLLVDESALEHAVQMLAAQQKVVAEGAGAAALAAVLTNPERFAGRRVGLVVSGGNIDRRLLSTVLMRSLAREGKVARLHIEIHDAPGVLAKVTRLIGDTGADIIDITHQRLLANVPPRFAELDITLEARGTQHVDEILAALARAGFRGQLR